MTEPTGTRVCMFVRNTFTTDARVEREARALVAAGCEVTVIALWDPARTARREMRDGYRVRRVSRWFSLVDAALRARERPARDAPGAMYARARRLPGGHGFRAAVIALRMAAAGLATHAHVYHAHDLNTLAPASWCARLRGARLVYDSHEIAPGQEGMRDTASAERKERRLIRRAHAVVHTTPERAAWAARTYGIEAPAVLLNVPDVEGEIAAGDLHGLLGVPADRRVLLHQGGMQRNRGLEALVDAAAKLDNRWIVALIGAGVLRPELERRAGERVRFAGPFRPNELLSYTPRAWCGFSLLVDSCLNHRWSLPNKLFEYLAAGVPVVVSDNPEIAAFVRALDIGEVCDPTSPASILDAVGRLELRYDEARAAAVAASKRYRWSEHRDVLLGIYRRVLDR